MKTIKNLLLVAAISCLLIGMVGCGNGDKKPPKQQSSSGEVPWTEKPGDFGEGVNYEGPTNGSPKAETSDDFGSEVNF